MAEDYVNHPSHYRWGSKECIEVIEDALTPEEYAGYLKGSEIKYIYRHEHKWDAEQDLEKCSWYLDRYKARFSKGNPAIPSRSDLASAYLYELSNVDDVSTEKLIMQYIEAVTYRDTEMCEAILIHLKERVSKKNVDKANTDPRMNQPAGEGSPSKDDASPKAPVPHDISENAKQIVSGLQFLQSWDAGLWENAYSFNYDDETNTLTVDTAINSSIDSRMDEDLIAFGQLPRSVTVKLIYRKHLDWSLTIETVG